MANQLTLNTGLLNAHAAGVAVMTGPANHINNFGGTSPATPLCAGAAALVLSANPALTYIEARQILRHTAVRFDLANTDPVGQWLDANGNPQVTSGLPAVRSGWTHAPISNLSLRVVQASHFSKVSSIAGAPITASLEVDNVLIDLPLSDVDVLLMEEPSAPPPAPTCFDGTRNQDESDVDCGGSTCPACDDGKRCESANDCRSGVCPPSSPLGCLLACNCEGTCAPPTCSDDVQNGNETGVAQGGSCCVPLTCPNFPETCGPMSDGCGGTLQCGCGEGRFCHQHRCCTDCEAKCADDPQPMLCACLCNNANGPECGRQRTQCLPD